MRTSPLVDLSNGRDGDGLRREKCSTPTLLALALAVTTLMLSSYLGSAARAGATPSGPSQVEVIVKQLRDQGYTVVVSRVGDTPPGSLCGRVGPRRADLFTHRPRCAGRRSHHHGHEQNRLCRRQVLTVNRFRKLVQLNEHSPIRSDSSAATCSGISIPGKCVSPGSRV